MWLIGAEERCHDRKTGISSGLEANANVHTMQSGVHSRLLHMFGQSYWRRCSVNVQGDCAGSLRDQRVGIRLRGTCSLLEMSVEHHLHLVQSFAAAGLIEREKHSVAKLRFRKRGKHVGEILGDEQYTS